jgi:hypothetical protein
MQRARTVLDGLSGYSRMISSSLPEKPLAGQAGYPGVFAEIGGPDGRGRLGEDIPLPLDVVDDRPADIDFLFQHIHLEDELYIGAGCDIHDRRRNNPPFLPDHNIEQVANNLSPSTGFFSFCPVFSLFPLPDLEEKHLYLIFLDTTRRRRARALRLLRGKRPLSAGSLHSRSICHALGKRGQMTMEKGSDNLSWQDGF